MEKDGLRAFQVTSDHMYVEQPFRSTGETSLGSSQEGQAMMGRVGGTPTMVIGGGRQVCKTLFYVIYVIWVQLGFLAHVLDILVLF